MTLSPATHIRSRVLFYNITSVSIDANVGVEMGWVGVKFCEVRILDRVRPIKLPAPPESSLDCNQAHRGDCDDTKHHSHHDIV
jgi:hypothetical protein